MRKNYGALVVGAGIGGIRAALDLALTGQKVALIDKRPSHGGILTQLDHQFPSDNCGMCKMLPLMSRDASSQFCLRKGLFHENIDIMLSTEMTVLEGDPGKFFVTLSRKSTLVDPVKCVSCGICAEVCPVEVSNEFNAGLNKRSAIYLPVPHAIPNHYVVDLENCQRCWQCYEACPTKAIDFKFDERKDFHILVADPDDQTDQFLADWLEAQNFPIQAVRSGNEAVDKLAEDDKFKLLLLDLSMEDMDPERVLLRARELRPDLDIILMATAEQEEKARELLAQGARDYILKPLVPKTLVPWLDKLYMRIMSDTEVELEVGAVVMATGFDCYSPHDNPQGAADIFMYGSHPGVVTAVEFERLCSGTGPSRGRLQRPGDGKPPRKIAWIQCVGSRDVRKNREYCSSICCMFSIKEALLAKKLTKGKADATIFYMDMRTHGKNFQRYRDQAEEENGVRFVRCRPHSIVPAKENGDVIVGYFGEDGEQHEEVFDMVVLATGVKPPDSSDKLMEVAGIETNRWGFGRTEEFRPTRTSRLGVFAAGAFGSPKDIAESVTQSSAAAQGAARMIKVYDVLTGEEAEPEPEYPDVSREAPKTLVALCASCPTLEESIDLEGLTEKLSRIHSVCKAAPVKSVCTREGWLEVEELARELKPNRILLGACMPYAYVPKLRELGRTLNLNPALMDVVDIYTPTYPGGNENPDVVAREIYSNLAGAVARLQGVDPVPPSVMVDVARSALVVGGGLAGMTASLAIADQGHEVCLVEESEQLGGTAMRLHYTLEGGEPQRFMEDLVEQVEKNPRIKVLKDSRVVLSRGNAGRFRTAIASDEGAFTLEHGVTILATGGHEAKNYTYGYKVHKTVLTQLELEGQMATGAMDVSQLKSVAMIQCVGSREEPRNYCSRVCCASALKNALFLKEKNPGVAIYVFYRDMMSYGFMEEFYTKARKAGVIFIRYDKDQKPKVEFSKDHQPMITARDHILDRDILIKPDLLVLSNGIEPNDVEDLVEIFGVEINKDGFFQEAESKWRPVDFLKQGIFMCGLAHSPGSMRETIVSAKAAAQRAMRILSVEKIARETVVASVRHSLCSMCQICVTACPYGARRADFENDMIVVDEILCQGCGSCAAVCPNSATILKGFHDNSMMAVIDAAVEELV